MRKRNAILGLELVAPSRDLGFLDLGLLACDSTATALLNRERSWSSSGNEIGGDGGGGRMCGAK